jgi:hypothetical protein
MDMRRSLLKSGVAQQGAAEHPADPWQPLRLDVRALIIKKSAFQMKIFNRVSSLIARIINEFKNGRKNF